MAIVLLSHRLPVSRAAIDTGLTEAHLPGRMQVINGPIPIIFDVAHNPAAVRLLAYELQKIPYQGKTHAVFSMLADKDIAGSIKAISKLIDYWNVAPLLVKRAATDAILKKFFLEITKTTFFKSIEDAYLTTKEKAREGDRIVVFGSFYTVATALKLEQLNTPTLS